MVGESSVSEEEVCKFKTVIFRNFFSSGVVKLWIFLSLRAVKVVLSNTFTVEPDIYLNYRKVKQYGRNGKVVLKSRLDGQDPIAWPRA